MKGESANPTIASLSMNDTVAKCPKCGSSPKGQLSCCGRGGAWRGKCGDDDEGLDHTWSEGVEACLCKIPFHFYFVYGV